MNRTPERVRHVARIHQENVEQAVIVVIEQGHSARHGLNQVFTRRWRIAQDKIDTVERRELELWVASYKLGKDRENHQHEQNTGLADNTSHSGYGLAAVPTSLLAGGCVSLMPAICASAVLITELYCSSLFCVWSELDSLAVGANAGDDSVACIASINCGKLASFSCNPLTPSIAIFGKYPIRSPVCMALTSPSGDHATGQFAFRRS